MDPDEPKKHINIKMPQKMDEKDFQNVVYPCCGLVEICKWGVQHYRYYGGSIEELLKHLLRNMKDVGLFVGVLFNSYDTMKNIMGQQTFKFAHYVGILMLPKRHLTATLH